MPQMINKETGESKEISMEEFLKVMQSGDVTIRQEVHHADGTVTSSSIYGNDQSDGVDRSVNIFASMDAIFAFVRQKSDKVDAPEENEQEAKSENGNEEAYYSLSTEEAIKTGLATEDELSFDDWYDADEE